MLRGIVFGCALFALLSPVAIIAQEEEEAPQLPEVAENQADAAEEETTSPEEAPFVEAPTAELATTLPVVARGQRVRFDDFLTDDELAIYNKLYDVLEPQIKTPGLVLYLTADVETCLVRIRHRQRTFARNMSPEYLAQLIDAYNHY